MLLRPNDLTPEEKVLLDEFAKIALPVVIKLVGTNSENIYPTESYAKITYEIALAMVIEKRDYLTKKFVPTK
jgi:hypothetical protein